VLRSAALLASLFLQFSLSMNVCMSVVFVCQLVFTLTIPTAGGGLRAAGGGRRTAGGGRRTLSIFLLLDKPNLFAE
jgi:hypothetical protein